MFRMNIINIQKVNYMLIFFFQTKPRAKNKHKNKKRLLRFEKERRAS